MRAGNLNGFPSIEMKKFCISLFYDKPSENSGKAPISHGSSVIPVF